MPVLIAHALNSLLAAPEQSAFRAIEYDLPETSLGWISLIGAAVLVVVIGVYVYLRDTADLSVFWRGWLLVLRLGVLAGLVVVAINPQERTQQVAYRPSQVAILVDRSLSMQFPESQPAGSAGTPTGPAAVNRSRAEAIQELLEKSDLIAALRLNHAVSVYSFDSALNGPHHAFRSNDPRAMRATAVIPKAGEAGEAAGSNAAQPAPKEVGPDWAELVRPVGVETRLGESLVDLIRQTSGRSMSGIVVISDGGANAGVDPQTAIDLARVSKVRLVTVGVGSIVQPVNLQISGLQTPSDVHVGDAFEFTAFLQSQGFAGKRAIVELLAKPENVPGETTLIESREVDVLEDGVPQKVTFERLPKEPGTFEYFVRTRPTARTTELSEADNERRKAINVVDRKTKVLIVAGGPMRDYHFVRNMLFRHSAIDTDIWLQSSDPSSAVSQESDKLLTSFPDTKEKLFEYDVLLAFDPDWSRLKPEQFDLIHEWVFAQSAGLFLVAGEVFSPETAAATKLEKIRELYPVVMNSLVLESGNDQRSPQAWPFEFTREGREAGFLQITDDPVTSAEIWKNFSGFYGCYPSQGVKAGATVYAHFSDPRSQTGSGQPVLLASQYYGSGRVLYLGSGEMWRLRALDEDHYDRFWTKAVREVGQARLKRGNNRGTVLLERNQYVLGQTVRVRAQVLDPQFNAVTDDSVTLDVFDPSGKPMIPPLKLQPDSTRAGQHVGSFRVSQPGTWRVELPIPQSTDRSIEKLDVVLPNLETDNARQNAQLLRLMGEDTGGGYFTLAEAAAEIPKRLPNQGEEFQIDQQLKTLWDRQWVLFVLVGLLAVEWLTRKLLKLA